MASFSPAGDSPYGVSDMAGNVYEWVIDDAVEPFQGFADTKNPINLLGRGQQFKMARGGSYGGPAEQLQCGYRQYARAATTRDAYVGFRCVSSPLTNHKEYMLSFLETPAGVDVVSANLSFLVVDEDAVSHLADSLRRLSFNINFR